MSKAPTYVSKVTNNSELYAQNNTTSAEEDPKCGRYFLRAYVCLVCIYCMLCTTGQDSKVIIRSFFVSRSK